MCTVEVGWLVEHGDGTAEIRRGSVPDLEHQRSEPALTVGIEEPFGRKWNQ